MDKRFIGKLKTIVVIPARLNSSRLPNKVLLDLGGKPLIQRVFERCCEGIEKENIWIACDDVRVKEVCLQFTDQVLMTKKNHQSGTDRIAEAIANLDADFIINVQGDEPFFDVAIISKLSNAMYESDAPMGSVYAEISSKEELENPNLVKVVLNVKDYAIYFSRFPIPFIREEVDFDLGFYKKHIGIYAYSKDFLLKYTQLPVSPLERMEKLEQLRAIENNFSILMIKTKSFEKGIDTFEDLEVARKKFK
jgi:3-deoxy-manno-octulosonate cytidylyltransferase (CMP-KDO synthetase)